jgi:hypothetical protein
MELEFKSTIIKLIFAKGKIILEIPSIKFIIKTRIAIRN